MGTEAKYKITAEDKTDKAIKSADAGFRKLDGLVKKVGVGLGVAFGVKEIVRFGKETLVAADNTAKIADRLGTSTEALSQYYFVAERTGVAQTQLSMGWQRMTRRIAEAAQGTGEAKAALRELNLEASALNRLRPEQQFEILADAIMGVKNPADQVRIAMKLFDSEGVALLQTMRGGSTEMRRLRGESDRLSRTLRGDQAAAAVAANDAITDMKAALTGAATAIAVRVAPAITTLASLLTNLATRGLSPSEKAFEEFLAGVDLLPVADQISRLRDRSVRLADALDLVGAAQTESALAFQSPASKLLAGTLYERANDRLAEYLLTSRNVVSIEQQLARVRDILATKTAQLNVQTGFAIDLNEKLIRDEFDKLPSVGKDLAGRGVVDLQGRLFFSKAALRGEIEEPFDVMRAHIDETQLMIFDTAQMAASEFAGAFSFAALEGDRFWQGFGDAAKSVIEDVVQYWIRKALLAGLFRLFPGLGAVNALLGGGGGTDVIGSSEDIGMAGLGFGPGSGGGNYFVFNSTLPASREAELRSAVDLQKMLSGQFRFMQT